VTDMSVFVARESRGRGVGDALLTALEARARANDYHKMVLAAFPTKRTGDSPVPAPRLARKSGPTTSRGCLDGRWVDVVVMEKILR